MNDGIELSWGKTFLQRLNVSRFSYLEVVIQERSMVECKLTGKKTDTSFMIDQIDLRLINSKTYKKLFPFLVVAFLASYLLSFVFVWPMEWIAGLIVLNLLVTLIVYIYSKSFKETGRLSIDIHNIVIVQKLKQPLIVPISLLEDFKISRGATIHKSDNGLFPAETHDNWISFTFNRHKYRLEFCILNAEENENFESLINQLRSLYPGFYYTSV